MQWIASRCQRGSLRIDAVDDPRAQGHQRLRRHARQGEQGRLRDAVPRRTADARGLLQGGPQGRDPAARPGREAHARHAHRAPRDEGRRDDAVRLRRALRSTDAGLGRGHAGARLDDAPDDEGHRGRARRDQRQGDQHEERGPADGRRHRRLARRTGGARRAAQGAGEGRQGGLRGDAGSRGGALLALAGAGGGARADDRHDRADPGYVRRPRLAQLPLLHRRAQALGRRPPPGDHPEAVGSPFARLGPVARGSARTFIARR